MIGNMGRGDNMINNTEEWKCISYFEKSEQCNVNRVHGHMCVCVCVCAKLLQLCLTISDPMDCSPLGSSVHGALQAITRR